MCRICETFTQLSAAQFAYDMSAAQLYTAGSEAAADRDDELAAAIDAELHVCENPRTASRSDGPQSFSASS